MESTANNPGLGPFPAIPWWRRLANRIWGYDFFVSYHWASGGEYAVKLAEALRQRNYDCFLDRSEFAGGDDWKHQASQALANTQRLIVIGTREALTISAPVRDEVIIFTARSERVIPILFGERVADTERHAYPTLNLISNRVVEIIEPAENQFNGPSDVALDQIEQAHSILRRRKLRAMLVSSVIAVLALATVAATMSFINAERQRLLAQGALVETQRELARSLVERGVRELESGNRIGLLRLARAYEVAERIGIAGDTEIPPDREMSQSARRLLAGWQGAVGRGLPHGSQIYDAQLSPDGSLVRIHTVNIDGEPNAYHFWDAQTGRPLADIRVDDANPNLVMTPDWSSALHWSGATLRRWSLVQGEMRELILPPGGSGKSWDKPAPYHTRDGRYAAIVDGSNMTMWDLEGGEKASILETGFDQPVRLGFSDDSTTLFVASQDRRQVRTYDIRSGQALGPAIDVPQAITSVVASRDGRIAAATLADGRTLLLASASGAIHASLEAMVSKPSFEFSEDGSVLLVRAGNVVRLVKIPSGSIEVLSNDEQVQVASLSPNGRHVVTVGPAPGRSSKNVGRSMIRVWETDQARLAHTFTRKAGTQETLHFSSAAAAILIADTERFDVYDLLTGHHLHSGAAGAHECLRSSIEGCRTSGFSPDGRFVYRLLREGPMVERLLHARLPEAVLEHPPQTALVVLSRDGRRLLAASRGGLAQVWNIAAQIPAGPPVEIGTRIHDAMFTADNEWIVTEAGDAWNAETGERLAIEHDRDLVVGRNGTLMLGGDDDSQIVDLRSGELLSGTIPYSLNYEELAFSDDRRHLASFGYGTDIYLHKVPDDGDSISFDPRRPGLSNLHEMESVDLLVFSPDSRLLLASTNFGTLRVWDIESRKLVMELTGADAKIEEAVFSGDGSILATLRNGAVTFWDVSTNSRVEGFHVWRARSLAFSEDEKHLLIAADEATYRWPVPDLANQPERISAWAMALALASWTGQGAPQALGLDALSETWRRLDQAVDN